MSLQPLLTDSLETAKRLCKEEDEYIVVLEWYGHKFTYAVTKEPHKLKGPELKIVHHPFREH